CLSACAGGGAWRVLSGRHLAKVETVAADISGRGGVAEAAEVDALDEQAVDQSVGAVAEKAGTIDISFPAIAISRQLPDRAPLLDLSAKDFSLPITTHAQAN